jgi:pyrroline-5-carboxylate reductase
MTYELGILGAGNMAEAIVRGVTAKKLFAAAQILAADPMPARRELFASMGVKAVESNGEVAKQSKVLLLSVKPQVMAAALAGIGQVAPADVLVISIAAGISTAFIEKHLGAGRAWRVIRTMPNTPMLVGEGIVGIAPGAHATKEDLAIARRIFESAAEVVDVPEDQIDTVTAVSGSGPAYFFLLVEQMITAGTELGLAPEVARKLAVRTALGSAKMLVGSADSPAELRRKVTSPNGTTHAAITYMESHNVPQILVDAVKAAQKRGRELGS